jgi:thiosulfate reductase cytochrome b subunit
MANPGHSVPTALRHKRWVKSTHWIITMSFIALAFSGFVILMAHPRLYWGDVGNDLTPALVDLPISRNYKHGGWEGQAAFFTGKNSQVTANRTYDIFNQNGWGRSLHFLSAWFLVVVGLIYLVSGIFTGHIRSNLLLRSRELSAKMFSADINSHLRMKIPKSTGGPQYGILQKTAYLVVIFFLLPVAILTGFTMSPAITATYPFLLKMFFGAQSARTIHFFASVALILFLVIHVLMIITSGFKQQMRSMTWGK